MVQIEQTKKKKKNAATTIALRIHTFIMKVP